MMRFFFYCIQENVGLNGKVFFVLVKNWCLGDNIDGCFVKLVWVIQ